ncbi:MAG: hypothetical protein JWQ42_1338 [Edaphobacter sp.]|jgi:hypothetical protein|nr:hypothetical protein [Edaphobacter sp.]
MPDTVAHIDDVGIGGVFAPGLVGMTQEGLDVCSTSVEEGAKDLARVVSDACRDLDYWVDGAQTFGPGSPEYLHEDGLCLVVKGVGGKDGVGLAAGDKGVEEVVADGSGGLLYGLAGLSGTVGNAGVVDMEGDIKAGTEVADEVEVGGGVFRGADAVVDVGCGKAYTEGFTGGGVGGMKREEKGDGVGSAGEGDADAIARFDVGADERERGGRHRIHVSCSAADAVPPLPILMRCLR